MNNTVTFFVAALSVAALSACATDRTVAADSSIELTDLAKLPAPTGEFFYTIGPQEKLEIEVVGAEEISGAYLTDVDGHIGFPYLGLVKVGGGSPGDAAEMIASGLREDYILDPQVRVIPEELPPPSITIGGEITKPGAYPAAGRVTLLQLVSQAEGLDQFAKEDDVLVFRTVEGRQYIGVYDIRAIGRGNAPDPVLYANDLVVVGDSPARRRLDNIIGLSPILTPVAILIDRLGS